MNGVLIESDWNLKLFSLYEIGWPVYFRINRFRLEFKDFLHRQELLFHVVLIESDWNLKYPQKRMTRIQNSRINRIRLEFKAGSAGNSSDSSCSINRIRLEFKVRR